MDTHDEELDREAQWQDILLNDYGDEMGLEIVSLVLGRQGSLGSQICSASRGATRLETKKRDEL